MKKLQRHEPCEYCGRYDNRASTVDAIVFNEGKVLLVKRGIEPYKGMWALPGGYVEWDETTEESTARELREETGLVAITCTLIGIFSHPSRHPKQVINASYLVSVEPGSAQAGDDAEEVRWWPLGSLPQSLAFDHEKIIQAARTKK